MKKNLKPVLVVLVVLLILSLLLRITSVKKIVAGVLNTTPENVSNTSVAVTFLLLGAVLLVVAAAFVSIPIVAVALVVAGLASAVWAVYNWYRPAGQKPENVSLSEKM